MLCYSRIYCFTYLYYIELSSLGFILSLHVRCVCVTLCSSSIIERDSHTDVGLRPNQLQHGHDVMCTYDESGCTLRYPGSQSPLEGGALRKRDCRKPLRKFSTQRHGETPRKSDVRASRRSGVPPARQRHQSDGQEANTDSAYPPPAALRLLVSARWYVLFHGAVKLYG